MVHPGAQVVRDQPGRCPAEEPERLHMRLRPRPLIHDQHRPHEHVPRARQHHHERLHPMPPPRRRVGPGAQQPVIDLGFGARRWGVAQHRHPRPARAWPAQLRRGHGPCRAGLESASWRARLITSETLKVPQVLAGGDFALQPLGAPELPLLPPPLDGRFRPLTRRLVGRVAGHAQLSWHRGRHRPMIVSAPPSRGHQPSPALSGS